MRFLSGAIAMSVLIGSAQAQTAFRADLNGAQEVPPVNTDAGGYGFATLNANDTVTYEVRTWIVAATVAHIHDGPVGVSGPILFTLSGGPSVWSGTTPALTAAQKAKLLASGLYFNVHSGAHSGGEIRGQIVPMPITFGAHLTGDQEVPPTGSTAFGEGTAIVNSNNSITYNVTTTGVTGTAAHIHTGDFGVSGGILFTLTGGPSVWSGTTAPMTAAEFTDLQEKGLYFNVHSVAFSGGEIRGQIVPTEIPYGFGCDSSVGDASLRASGAAMRGGTLTLTLTGGLPNGSGLLIFSLDDGVGILKKHCPYLLGAPLLIVTVPTDATGGFVLGDVVPDLAFSLDVFFQYFGFDPASTHGGLYASNGLLVPLFDY